MDNGKSCRGLRRGEFPSVTPARAFFTMGDSPFFTTSASESFFPSPASAGALVSQPRACRGELGISTRLQSERSYLRSKVPDGVSHLFPCTAGALFPEANSLLLPLPVTPARAFFTMGDSPFFTTSASEFFLPLARAVFMTSETSPSHPPKKSLPRAVACARSVFAMLICY